MRTKTDHHHHHMSVKVLGYLLIRSGLRYLEVSSEVCHDSFCQYGNSVSLSWWVNLYSTEQFTCLVYHWNAKRCTGNYSKPGIYSKVFGLTKLWKQEHNFTTTSTYLVTEILCWKLSQLYVQKYLDPNKGGVKLKFRIF